MLLKFMLVLGGTSINLPVFNLNITCLSELSLFKNCPLPADMPELASESVVSIPCKVLSKVRKDLCLVEKNDVETTRIFGHQSFDRPSFDGSNVGLQDVDSY